MNGTRSVFELPSHLVSYVMQGCLIALQQFVSNNLLIIASVAIAFLVGEVSLHLNSKMTIHNTHTTHPSSHMLRLAVTDLIPKRGGEGKRKSAVVHTVCTCA